MSIEIANESSAEVSETTIVSVARFALDRMNVSQLAELSIVVVERDVMADLHERWMDLAGPTDVMAFPMDEYGSSGGTDPGESDAAMLGDIVLCPSFAEEQAHKAGHGLAEELHLLTVHGVLHLLGYDHAEPEEEREMFSLQNRLLAEFRQARAEAVQHDADSRVLGAVGLDGSSEGGTS